MNNSKHRKLNCRGTDLQLGNRTIIMGILNITPDSFSDGGKYFDLKAALRHAELMIDEGAEIIDVGAESTRPGHTEISAEEEWTRLEPILKEILSVTQFRVPISVDTQKSEVAERALALGVHIINDIWGLQKDPLMAKVIGGYNGSVILMHNRDNTRYMDLMGEIIQFLEKSIELALAAGISEDQIIVDPGIGFGKTTEQNIEVMQRLGEFKTLGYPLLLGVSRKSIIGKTLSVPVEERLEPTIALGTLGIAAGAEILRVHDVWPNKKAARMADQIVRQEW